MNGWYELAAEKLTRETSDVKGTRESAMKTAVRDVLLDFCRQDAEFAQAVAQGGGFPDCMSAVAKGVGRSISDLDAYKRAVEFYFPGAKIEMQMQISLCPGEFRAMEEPDGGVISLSFSDLFD